MKKLTMLLLSLLIVTFFQPASAGEQTMGQAKMQIGLQGNANYYLATLDDNDYDGLFSPGLGGFIDYRLTKNFALNLSLEYNQVNIDYPAKLTNTLMLAALKGKFFLVRSKSISPFLNLGAGLFSFQQDNGYFTDNRMASLVTGGIGAEIPLSKKINLIPMVNVNSTINEDLDLPPNSDDLIDDQYLHLNLGISFKLGGPKPKKPAPEPVEEEVEEEVEKVEEKVEEEEEPEEMEVEEEVEEAEEIEEKPEEKVEKMYYEKLQYMIQPNDYLIKIAGNMYEDKSMWRDIYDWNRDLIGDNPNLIYPFHELLLKQVPIENTNELEYDFYNYEIGSNETLWSIAAEEYGNPYAWIVIYRDNKDILGEEMENLEPGTVIKLRDKLFNK